MREIKFRAWDKEERRMVDDISTWTDDFTDTLNKTIEYKQDHNLELMQFTGLNDKNGKEIYEGDILKHDLWGNSQIIWEHGGFRGVGTKHDITLADHQLARSRVIGNIYENPKLLK